MAGIGTVGHGFTITISKIGYTIIKVLLVTLFGIIAIDHGMDGTMSLKVGTNFLSRPSQNFLQVLAVTSSTKEPAKIGTKFNRI